MGGCYEIVEAIVYQNIGEHVFFCDHVVVFENQFPVEIMESGLVLGPREDALILLENFKSFYPEWHTFEFLLWPDLSINKVAIRIKRKSLFWDKPLQKVQLVHEAAIDASSYKLVIIIQILYKRD